MHFESMSQTHSNSYHARMHEEKNTENRKNADSFVFSKIEQFPFFTWKFQNHFETKLFYKRWRKMKLISNMNYRMKKVRIRKYFNIIKECKKEQTLSIEYQLKKKSIFLISGNVAEIFHFNKNVLHLREIAGFYSCIT